VIAVKLAELRKSRGLSQRRLAAAAHVPNSKVIALESGVYKMQNVTLAVAKRLADALGVTMEELLELD